jgi:hypothetical protein
MSMITQEQLIGWAREIDAQLPIPTEPEDTTTPLDFGRTGIVVMSDNAPLLIAVGDDPFALLESDDVRVFARGYGAFFMVTYGGVIQQDMETGETEAHIARCIMGMTYNGVNTALMRFLDNDHIEVDLEGSGAGSAHEAMLEVFA